MRHSWLLVLLVLAACSSFKPPALPQAKLDADSFLRFALSLEDANDLSGAAENYQYAYSQYRSLGDPAGQLAAKSGLARLALAKGDQAGYQNALTEVEAFSALHGSALDYIPMLLKIHKLQSEKNHEAVSQLAVSRADYPVGEILRLKAIKLQADSYLKQANEAQAKDLIKLVKAQQKRYGKGESGDADLLSTAWYALGYYYFRNGAYLEAANWTEKSVDWDYRTGDLSAYAHGLWLLAQIATAKNQDRLAQSYYDRAYGVFEGLGDTASQTEIRSERRIEKETE